MSFAFRAGFAVLAVLSAGCLYEPDDGPCGSCSSAYTVTHGGPSYQSDVAVSGSMSFADGTLELRAERSVVADAVDTAFERALTRDGDHAAVDCDALAEDGLLVPMPIQLGVGERASTIFGTRPDRDAGIARCVAPFVSEEEAALGEIPELPERDAASPPDSDAEPEVADAETGDDAGSDNDASDGGEARDASLDADGGVQPYDAELGGADFVIVRDDISGYAIAVLQCAASTDRLAHLEGGRYGAGWACFDEAGAWHAPLRVVVRESRTARPESKVLGSGGRYTSHVEATSTIEGEGITLHITVRITEDYVPPYTTTECRG